MSEWTATEAPDAGRAGIQALDSALRVLRVMAQMPGPVTLGEIARHSGMPASKAHRYLASFIKAGLARQTHRGGQYTLAKGALELGLAAMARMDLVQAVVEQLEDLVHRTGAAGLVAVWGPHGATVVRWHRTGSFVITTLGLGSTLPLLNSATGRIFLAWLPRRVIAEHLEDEVQRARHLGLVWPDLDPSHPEALARLVEGTRTQGFASVDGRFIPGLNAISAPVLNWQGEVEAAVTLVSGDRAILTVDSPPLAMLRELCASVSVPGPGGTGGSTAREDVKASG